MSQLILTKRNTPSNPETDKVSIYAKTDGNIYSIDDLGNETLLSSDLTTILDHEAAPNPHPQYVLKLNLDKTEYRTLTAADISNKYLMLAATPFDVETVRIDVKHGGGAQFYGEDFIVSSNLVVWDGYELENILEEGDKMRIVYCKL